jgi:signal transduction histidine kinase
MTDGITKALAVLTVGAFATLAIGVLGSDDPPAALLLGAAFTVLATAGYHHAAPKSLAWRYFYAAVQFPLAFIASTYSPSVGATLFMVVLVSQSVLLLPKAVTAALVLAFPLVHLGMTWAEGLREGFGALVAVVFAAVITELLVREQRARARLAEAHARLRDYTAQAERLATAQERNRVARDIHDGLGHSLTIVQMQVKAARAVLPTDPGKADDVLAKAQHQAETALAEVRRSVAALREPRPLLAALRALADENPATELRVEGERRDLPDDIAEVLFRVAQEGLTNVRKHARATRAELLIDYAEGTVSVQVSDDGTGVAGNRSGYGLLGLRERAERVGGSLEVEFAAGRGCAVRVEVPG